MAIETIKQNTDRIPLKERNVLQSVIMTKMGVARGDIKAQEEWSKKYILSGGNMISKIIDDPENLEIRNNILSGKFDVAAELVIKKLEDVLVPAEV